MKMLQEYNTAVVDVNMTQNYFVHLCEFLTYFCSAKSESSVAVC